MKKNIFIPVLNTRNKLRGLSICMTLLFGLAAPQWTQAQETVLLGQNITKWNSYQTHHLPEKMFVHTAKEIYVGGETIWLKIYTVDGWLHQPLAMSRVAYVELIDAGRQSVAEAKIGLHQGIGDGYLELPPTLAPGTYLLRAYSNWMKNSGPGYFFEKPVVVLNGHAKPLPVGKPHINFYPEGGVLPEDRESTVAFDMKDAFGHGLACSGVILDNGRDSIGSFHSYKQGIGKFEFTPRKGHIYKARIQIGKDSLWTDLPVATVNGLYLRLETTTGSKCRLLVQSTPGAAADSRFNYVYLLLHNHGLLKLATGAILNNGQTVFEFDRSQLGDGVSQALIMDKDFNVLGERLLFNYPADRLTLSAGTNKEKYARREKISLNVAASQTGRQPELTHVSIGVFKIDSLQQPPSQISNYLLLQSDIEESVDQSESYFPADSLPDLLAIDNLMLTKTFRRFSWRDIVRADSPVFEPEIYGPLINGRMVSTVDGSPAKHISSYISVPGRNTNFRPAETDGNGRIKFEMVHFTGNESVVFNTNTKQDSTYRITLENPFSRNYANRTYPAYSFPTGDTNRLSDRQIGARLAEIFNTDSTFGASRPNADTTYFYGQADESYLLDNYTRFTTMEEVLREYVVSVNVFRKAHKLDMVLLDAPLKRFFENEPLVLVDGVPFFDIDEFMHLNPLKIRKIELVTRPYFLGTQEYDGIVNCVTYHGDLDGIDLNRHASIIAYPGIQPAKAFHAKSYETEAQQSSRLPDFRDLLYWLPEISLNTTEKKQLDFYASDLPGRYEILVQGLTRNGQSASRTIFVTVTR